MKIIPVGKLKAGMLYLGSGRVELLDTATMAKMLFPHAKHPEDQVRIIYRRHKTSFTDRDRVILESDTPYNPSSKEGDIGDRIDLLCLDKKGPNSEQIGTRKKAVMYWVVPSGVAKLCKFSRSPYAVDVLMQCIDWVELYHSGRLPKPDPSLAAIIAMPKHKKGRGAMIAALAVEKGVNAATIRRKADRQASGEPLKKRKHGPRPENRDKFEAAKKLRLENYDMTNRDIAKHVGINEQLYYHWAKAFYDK